MKNINLTNAVIVGSLLLYGCGSGTDIPDSSDSAATIAVTTADSSAPVIAGANSAIEAAQAAAASGESTNSQTMTTALVETTEPVAVTAPSIEAAQPDVETAPVVETTEPTSNTNELTDPATVTTPSVETPVTTQTTATTETAPTAETTETPTATATTETSTTTETPAAAGEAVLPNLSPLLVFPGAEGFGTNSTAGRGGEICKVTSLADSGEGTLRSCVERSGPRIVLFEVGGTIEVDTPIRLEDPFISIYGQSAPGDGIMLRGSLESIRSPILVMSHDVLIQHMRIRAGTSRGISCCRDALSIGNSKPGRVYNIVLDHNSFAWGIDEIVDIWFDSHDITLSYNIMAESLFDSGSNDKGPAGRGLLIGSDGAHSISVHHNLLAHTYQRNPLVKTTGTVDVTNNLIYHYTSRAAQQHSVYSGQQVNWVKNMYIPLLGQATSDQDSKTVWGDLLVTKGVSDPQMYLEDNLGFNRANDDDPQILFAHTDWNEPYDPSLGYLKSQRFPAPTVTEASASSLEANLLPHVGATLPDRDSVDNRILSNLENRTGKLPNCVAQEDRPGESRCDNNVGGWPTLSDGPTRVDSDNDGMPDDWETTFGLNPNVDDSSGDINNDGYTNIEHWLHSLSN